MPESNETRRAAVTLIGAGVVGRAILRAHIDAGVSVCLADQQRTLVEQAVEQLDLDPDRWQVSPIVGVGELPALEVTTNESADDASLPIVIESISERLEAKRAFFADAERIFGDDALLCSNTSTLRIGTLAQSLQRAERFCGMHFFMPVDQRDAVEVIAGESTSPSTIESCNRHVRRIGKHALAVGDGPGFVVNRLLTPYLNEAMLLLGRGIDADQIERAALAYGMPMSPLELIDLIGARTAFDGGRVYWQAFPSRIDPSPMLSALVKRKLLGRAVGRGLYDYQGGTRSRHLSSEAAALCDRYRRDECHLSDDQVMRLLAVPMWIEAAMTHRDGVTTSPVQLDEAMRGGLGFDPGRSWLGFFDDLGSDALLDTITQWSPRTPCMQTPDGLLSALRDGMPSEAISRFAGV